MRYKISKNKKKEPMDECRFLQVKNLSHQPTHLAPFPFLSPQTGL